MAHAEAWNTKMKPFKSAINDATKCGEDVVRLYYQTLEQRPHRAYLVYLDSGVVLWDGNPHVGGMQIKKFFEELPSLKFQVTSMDVQPISDVAVGSQSVFLINTFGAYRIAQEKKSFCQTFTVTTNSFAKWKIATDTFRSQVSPNQVWF